MDENYLKRSILFKKPPNLKKLKRGLQNKKQCAIITAIKYHKTFDAEIKP
jgi:hypothetical protein